MNYESEVGEVLLEGLRLLYGIKEDRYVFVYGWLRFRLIEGQKKSYDAKSVMSFFLSELNITLQGSHILYKETPIYMVGNFQNSLSNIFEEWLFRAEMFPYVDDKGVKRSFFEWTEKEWEAIQKEANQRSKKAKKKQKDYEWIYHALTTLAERFNAHTSEPVRLNGFNYPAMHNDFAHTWEEICLSHLHALQLTTNDISLIDESVFEFYCMTHLEEIEVGLKLMDSQVVLPDGRIDILAKDQQGRIVILELKVREDARLLWQASTYPMQWKLLHPRDEIRMITLAPQYSDAMLMGLKKLDSIEVVQYDVQISQGTIQSMMVNWLTESSCAVIH
jgi:hypothetical protein